MSAIDAEYSEMDASTYEDEQEGKKASGDGDGDGDETGERGKRWIIRYGRWSL